MREYNEGDAYNYFDMSIFALDLIIMLLLSLSVCSESIGGGLEPLRLRSRDRAGLDLDTLAAKHHHLRGNGTARHGRLQVAHDLVLRVAILCAVHPPGVCAAQGTTIPARNNTQTGKQRPTKRRRAHAARAR